MENIFTSQVRNPRSHQIVLKVLLIGLNKDFDNEYNVLSNCKFTDYKNIVYRVILSFLS